jgi:hypothetical protein
MKEDPVQTNPDNYRLIFENDRVRVLEYSDAPGHVTTEHYHPDSVMITTSAFRRRISSNGKSVDVELPSGAVRWVAAQHHVGENTGETETHTFFVELKDAPPASVPTVADDPLGPTDS